MATIVKGDLYEQLDGKLHEIKRQMQQKDGYAFDPQRLDLALQAVIEGRFEAVGGQFPSIIHAADLIPKGWSVAIIDGVPQDVAPSEFDISKIKPRTFLKDGKPSISGEGMRKRAVELKGNLGLSDGKRMLADGGKLIPIEFQCYYIPLPGTLLRDSDGYLHVPCLHFLGDRWCLSFFWLGNDWGAHDRLACSE